MSCFVVDLTLYLNYFLCPDLKKKKEKENLAQIYTHKNARS